MHFFDELGSLVGNLWKGNDYNDDAFAEVSVRALSDLSASSNISVTDIIKWAITSNHLPYQHDIDARFGQPPLTVYWGRQFRIEVLFWLHSLPAIHQHSFSGAFQVFQGSSLHAIWGFALSRTFSSRLLMGQIELREVEILNAGDVRPIYSGTKFIHSTFHLEQPSVSIVVRTNRDNGKLPQYTYLPPSIAYDPLDVDADVLRRIQLLDTLRLSGDNAQFYDAAYMMISQGDSYSVFLFFQKIYQHIDNNNDKDGLLAAARQRHPELMEAMATVLAASRRREKVVKLRKNTDDPELQFFLALLLNIPDRRRIINLINLRFPKCDTSRQITKWAGEVISKLADKRSHEEELFVLELIMKGSSSTEVEANFQDSGKHGSLEIPTATQRINDLKHASILFPLFE